MSRTFGKRSSEESVYSSELRAELVLQFNGANELFEQLQTRHAEIDEKFGEHLLWDPAEGSQRCRIYVRRDGDYTDEGQWPDQFAWMTSRLEKLRDIFCSNPEGVESSGVSCITRPSKPLHPFVSPDPAHSASNGASSTSKPRAISRKKNRLG